MNISGPTPWIDVTTYGAKADGLMNVNGSILLTSATTVTISGAASFFSFGDIGKAISVNGAGIAGPGATTPGAPTFSAGGGVNCGSGATVYAVATFVQENGGRKVSESVASNEVSSVTCTGSNIVTIAAPNGTTPWIPYASFSSGSELYQATNGGATAGHCTTTATGACAGGASWSSGSSSASNLLADTARPPASPMLFSIIQAVAANGLSATIADMATTAVSSATVAWGTDNSAAITSAIDACINTAQLGTSNQGCTVYFPGPTAISTGKYFITSGINVVQNLSSVNIRNLTLVGGGSFGSGDVSGYLPSPSAVISFGASAEIVGSGRFTLMTFGNFGAQNVDGLNILNLGFRDVAGNANTPTDSSTSGNTWGAVRLINVIHPYLERLNAEGFANGYGVELEGDPAAGTGAKLTQIGVITNSNCSVCRIGIWAPQAVSDILVEGGWYSGSGAGPFSYGADFETNLNGSTNGTTTGSIRIIGTAFRNHVNAAVNFFNCGGCQIMGVKGEQVGQASPPGAGTAIQLSGTSGTSGICINDQIVGGTFANYATGVSVSPNCTQSLVVLPSLYRVTTPSTGTASLPIELSGANGLLLGGVAAQTPTIAGQFVYNSSINQYLGGLSGATTGKFAMGVNTSTANDVVTFNGSDGVTLSDSGVQASQGCQSGCHYILGFQESSGQILGNGAAVLATNSNNVFVMRIYNQVTRKLGSGFVWVQTPDATGKHSSIAVYSSSGGRVWTSGQLALPTSGTGSVVSFTSTPTSYIMQPGIYYLAYCTDSTAAVLTSVVNTGAASAISSFLSNSPTNTYGIDSATGDKCTNGTLPSSIAPGSITNGTTAQIAAVMITN